MNLTQEMLKEILHYNSKTGIFIWKKSNSNVVKIGQVAGFTNGKGYIEIGINKKYYKAHRLAFLYMTGKIPNTDIDHKDRNRTNNKWNNLRAATRSQNIQNSNKPITNTSGYKGIFYIKDSKRNPWGAKIVVNSKSIYLGCFKTKIDAAKAYDQAALKYFGEYAKLNFPVKDFFPNYALKKNKKLLEELK